MPKISKNTIQIYNKKQSNTNFVIDILYNQDLKFYAVIPAAFNENFDLLSGSELEGFAATRKYKSVTDRVSSTQNFERIISSDTEVGVLSNMKRFLEYLIDFTIVSRNVIILFFNTNGTTYNNMSFAKSKYPQIQMELGLVYCVETSIPNVGTPKYMQYRKTERLSGGFIEEKSEFNIWGKQCTVIDDTEENRAFLEKIYNGFSELISAMKEFTKTPEALLQLIGSGLRLIG